MSTDVEALAQATRAPLPTDPATFDADERISFSKVSNTFLLEAEDGQEFEWEHALKRWVPALDHDLQEQQSKAYVVQGVDEGGPGPQPGKKRKKENADYDDHNGLVKKPKPKAEPKERKNTAVYVTNLPFNATVDELNTVFARCGMIAENMETQQPRIKMYTNDEGRFKGDALVVYFKPESVSLAIQLLDDSEFRLGKSDGPGTMRVARADFSYKSQKEAPVKQSEHDRQRVMKKTSKLNSKLADWSSDEDVSTLPTAKYEKVVVLKYMFTLDELKQDPAAALDIKDDIRDECGKLGTVTNVVLYDEEPHGVVTVRFSDPISAQACVRTMNGRHFDGRTVHAYVQQEKEHFRKSGKREDEDDEELGSAARNNGK